MKKKVKNILITMAVTVGILAMIEVAARVILSRVYNRSFDSSLIEAHKYGPTSGLKANASGTVWGKAFHTDDMGGRRHTKSKKGKPKMLVIGDSVAEGVGVEDSATFANLLDESDNYWDTRNISMIGWSSSDYRNVLEAIMANDTSIKEVVLFYCLNDIYGKDGTGELPHMGLSGRAGGLNTFLQNHCGTYKLLKLLVYQHSDKYFRYDEALYKDTARVSKTAADIAYMSGLCNSRGGKLVVALVPYRSQLEGRSSFYPQHVITKALGKTTVMIYDLAGNMKLMGDPDSMYLFGDEIHLSKAGHRVVALLFGVK